jgi:glutamine amidotransferase
MPKAIIIDYGVGNLLSLKFALEKAGLSTGISEPTKKFEEADAIALPGVGNFSAAAKTLENIKDEISQAVEDGKPILGICLGLQLYFETSEEGPGSGLGFFKGTNVYLKGPVKVPHMGWNTLQKLRENELFDGVKDGAYVYFVHSLYPIPIEKDIVCTQTEYSTIFTSAVAKKNIYGTQFHPEKSGETGLTILKNFAREVVR